MKDLYWFLVEFPVVSSPLCSSSFQFRYPESFVLIKLSVGTHTSLIELWISILNMDFAHFVFGTLYDFLYGFSQA